MKTIATWLPVFSGFYGTIWEPDETREIEYINEERENKGLEPLEFDAFEFDYEGYRQHCAKQFTNAMEDHLKGFVSGIEFERVRSPREYNFHNDAIDVKISLTRENTKKIGEFLKEHEVEFQQYIKETYTSCSGFISFYPNDAKVFVGKLNKALEHEHKLGAILQFIATFEDGNDTELNLYYRCNDLNLEVSNYDELIPS